MALVTMTDGQHMVAKTQLQAVLAEGVRAVPNSTVEARVKRLVRADIRTADLGTSRHLHNIGAVPMKHNRGYKIQLLSVSAAAQVVYSLGIDPIMMASLRQARLVQPSRVLVASRGRGFATGRPPPIAAVDGSIPQWGARRSRSNGGAARGRPSQPAPQPHGGALDAAGNADMAASPPPAAAPQAIAGTSAPRLISAGARPAMQRVPKRQPFGMGLQDMSFLPATLPPCHISAERLKATKTFALSTLTGIRDSDRAAMAAATERMRRWACDPVNLNRPDHMAKRLSAASWKARASDINAFTGYCCLFEGITRPCLELYLDAHLVAASVSFMLAKGLSQGRMVPMVCTAEKVVWFLDSESGGNGDGLTRELVTWLQRLGTQLRRNVRAAPRRSLKQLRETSKWVEAPELAEHVRGLVRTALSATCQDPERRLAVPAAQKLFVAFLAGLTSGSLIPPPRPSCVQSMLMPCDGERACIHPDCDQPAQCMGNCLYWADAEHTQLGVHFAHHKTSTSARGAPITFTLPPLLNTLAVAFVTRAHPLLTVQARAPVHHVFFRWKTLEPIRNTAYGGWWKGLVLQDTGWDMGPQLMRHVFVSDVLERQAQGLPAPAPADAALIMGNSERAWQRHYWLTAPNARTRSATNAAQQTERMFAANLDADPPPQSRRVGSWEWLRTMPARPASQPPQPPPPPPPRVLPPPVWMERAVRQRREKDAAASEAAAAAAAAEEAALAATSPAPRLRSADADAEGPQALDSTSAAVPYDMVLWDVLMGMPVRELRSMAEAQGKSTAAVLYKADLVKLLMP